MFRFDSNTEGRGGTGVKTYNRQKAGRPWKQTIHVLKQRPGARVSAGFAGTCQEAYIQLIYELKCKYKCRATHILGGIV